MLNKMSNRDETLADIAPGPGIYERNAPVWRPLTQNFDFLAEVRNDAVAVCRLACSSENTP